jgi:predicted amidohydrolase
MPLNNRMRRSNADAWRHRHIENLEARARETGCWVVSADIVAEGETRMSYGCTAIVTPDGTVAARVPEKTVGQVVYDVALVPR